ncbi:DeoR family transcriptional regulator [Allokutzneria albata]|uniref:DeoR family transcriptional regulator n=1 Tax=Allokutzneria albata TaxID=211114 RepID=UPI003898EEFE
MVALRSRCERPCVEPSTSSSAALRIVQVAGRISVADLAERLGVLEMTVRRDLDSLREQGLVTRVRGGSAPRRTA